MKSPHSRVVMIVIAFALVLDSAVASASAKKGSALSAVSSGLSQMHPSGAADKGGDSFQDSLASVVGRTVAAVVNIASSKTVGFNDQFVELPAAARRDGIRSLGSGVIVMQDGHILTNYHVVEHALDIKVFLSDNRELNARVIGIDPNTDIAVLKVDAEGLPVLKFGRSSEVRVGDFVLAIGDPFGLRETVTSGIVSGTGRSGLGIQRYEDFIQTDAAINPGSSGGALINLRGELIGIVTAGKEYSGVGFAVPIDMAGPVMDQILIHGRVIRGWLGTTVQPLTDATAKAFSLTGELRGALVADVTIDSPARRAGLRAGDIILKVDGKPVRDDRNLNLLIGTKMPGAAVRLTAYRDGREKEFTIVLIEEPAEKKKSIERETARLTGPLGLSVQTVSHEISQQLDLAPQTRGVIVTGVTPGSRAAAARLAEGDIIVEINHKIFRNTDDFNDEVRASNLQPVLLLIERSGIRMFVVVGAE